MAPTRLTASLLATLTLISSAIATPILDTRSTTSKRAASPLSLAVYWGQGPNQPRLADFCQDATIDVIPIGFVNTFPDQTDGNNGYPGTNYGNACGSPYWVAPDGTQTEMFTTCTQIAEDIPICQALGKKILVSLGGASSGNFIASAASAKEFADFLWGSYGPPQDTTETLYPRPFGQTIVDGFDLDIESGGSFGYADLVNEFRALFAGQSKQYYISSAPQCVVPDAHLADAIANSDIDYVFVQYYNTDSCSAASLFSSGTLNTGTDVSFGWADWLRTNSKNPNVKLFVGLPASTAAAHPQDYLDLDEVKALLNVYACNSAYQSIFGGVMLWEATYSADNQINGESYAQNVKDLFSQLSCSSPSTTTISTATSTTTTLALSTMTTTTTAITTTVPVTTTTTTPVIPTTTTTPTTTSSSFPGFPYTSSSSSVSTTTSAAFSSVATSAVTTSSSAATTTTSSYAVGPIGGSASSSTSTSTSTSTTSNAFSVGPIGGSTTATSSTSSTSSYAFSVGPIGGSTTTTSSASSYAFSVGPIGGATTTTSSTTSAVAAVTTSTSTSTVSSGYAVGPVGGSITTSSTTSTTSTAIVGPVSGASSTSTTPVAVVSPILSSAASTTTSPFTWEDWTTTAPIAAITTSSASVVVAPDYTTTVWVTSYIDICPTGFTTLPYTLTTTVPVVAVAATATTTFVWPTETNGCPSGFTTTVTVCTVCAETWTTVTLTVPIATVTAVETQTVVPVPVEAVQLTSTSTETGALATETVALATATASASTETSVYTLTTSVAVAAAGAESTETETATPAGTIETSTIVSAAAPAATSTVVLPNGGVKTLSLASVVSAATATGTGIVVAPSSNSGWLAPSQPEASASSVAPANVATYTGGAAQSGLPGTVLSLAVCMVVAVAGSFI
ncbi:hypothetical protein A1O1_01966 [Capronia coronata CBS 617.96]|uniref:chitinase n=1 Tax=Capronia coronata CBS 617.96 TaxID=1182541 RepID=W9ZGE8_9EURO|nr:uncharacterized protein A1O1_01966 [Capronia coronata CBS 617.96]EXJ93574.1 hypothetical protein A1O1_01966 [Capronia coronata CBS 617.96]